MDTETTSMGGFGWLILIFLFLFAFNGNGVWGNRGGYASGADVYAKQAAEYSIATDKQVAVSGLEAQLATMDASYKTLLGFKDAQAQMAACCCDIKAEIAAQAQANRDLINGNTILELRDQLNSALTAINIQTQTKNLVDALRPYPTPSYIVGSPYTSLYGNGCGCGGYTGCGGYGYGF